MRLFVALDISDELREALERLRPQLLPLTSLRLVDPESMHLTLKFLGEVSEEKISKVIAALEQVDFSPVKLQTTKLGTFPKVLWLGLKLNSDLAQLQERVQRAVKGFAMYDSRSYKPHLTLARFQRLTPSERSRMHRLLKTRIEQQWKAESFVLYKSEMTPLGPIYSVVQRFS